MLFADPILAPAVRIEKERISGKAAGPPGIVVEMLNAPSDAGIGLVIELAYFTVSESVTPVDWEVSSIVNGYKGKGDAFGTRY